MNWQIKDESELTEVAKAVLVELGKQKDGGSAAVLGLSGDLGAGKTTFMQTLAKELRVSETITSPTFVIMKNYELENQAWEKLVHIDAYRIEDIDEMRPLGFAELLEEEETILCIEWAEKISKLLPPKTLHLNFNMVGEDREISLTNA